MRAVEASAAQQVHRDEAPRRTDKHVDRGRPAAARVLLLGSRPAEARQAAQDALAVAERKGDLASSSLARALLGELRSTAPGPHPAAPGR